MTILRRRPIIGLLGLLLIGSFGLSACGSPTVAKKPITIAFIPSLATDPFFISMQYGAQQEAKKLGVKLIWTGAGVYSPSAQLPYVDAVLAEHPSALILVPTDPKALIPPVEQARAAHIPVINVDTVIANTSLLASHITGDNVGGGKLAVKLLAQALGGKGQIYLMNGTPGATTEILRAQGVHTELKNYPGVQLVGTQYSEDQPSLAETEIRAVVTRYPNLGGVFAVDDTTAEGVIAGLAADGASKRVKLVAYDAEPAEVAALKNGTLLATVAQRPGVEGALAVLYAYDEVTHKTAAVVHSVIVADILLTASTLSKDSQWFYCTSISNCHITWQPTKANGAP